MISSEDPKSVVRRWWAAFERSDLDAVLDCMTEDMVWEVMSVGHLMPSNGVYRGKKMIMEQLVPFAHQAYDMNTFKLDITAMYAEGSTVIMEFTVNSMTNTGRAYVDAKYISVVKLVDGKIASAREYPDGVKALDVHFG